MLSKANVYVTLGNEYTLDCNYDSVDLVFFNGSDSNTIVPWRTSGNNKLSWIKEWLPIDLFNPKHKLNIRTIIAKYTGVTNIWENQFPLLEISKDFIKEFKRRGIGGITRSTIFFAWGFDSLLLKQLIYLASITQEPVSKKITKSIFINNKQNYRYFHPL